MRLIFVFTLLLAFFSSALAEISKAPWPDISAGDVVPYQMCLTHGPMLGRITSNSVRVWVRTAKPSQFRVCFDTSLPLNSKTPFAAGQTLAKDDNTGSVDIVDLKPDTRYYYGIMTKAGLCDTRMNFQPGFPSFKTLPDPCSYFDPNYNPKGSFNFSFSSIFCHGQSPSRHYDGAAFTTMMDKHGKDMRFIIINGDYIYEETRTRQNLPHTVEMFRNDYKIYMERGRGISNVFRHVPAFFMYDDHEVYSDLEGSGEVGLKDGKWLYRDLAMKPWYEYAAWANFTDGPQHQPVLAGTAQAKAGSDILFDSEADFTKLRPDAVSTVLIDMKQKNSGVYGFAESIDKNRIRLTPAFTADETCTYTVGTHHYFDFKLDNCHFFVLDTRGERNRSFPRLMHSSQRSILGPAQEKWLIDGIKRSDADFVFIVSSVSWVIHHSNFIIENGKKVWPKFAKEDGFIGSVVERDRLLDFFKSIPKQFIILTGDLHNAYAIQIEKNIYEFMLGPVTAGNHGIEKAGFPPYADRYDSEGRQVNIKWMSSYPTKTSPREVYYGIFQVNNVFKAGKATKPGLHWIAYKKPQVVAQVYDGYTGDLVYAEGISMIDACK